MTWRAILLALVVITVYALASSDQDRPVPVVEAHSSGRWDFNNADYRVCFAVKNPPLLRSPENSPYEIGKKYNDGGEV